jgi:20S proteasome alpha/beta subunit
MFVDQLAVLAAYCVRQAHEQDTKYVDGLDIAIYRDSTRQFEEVKDRSIYWNAAARLDADLKSLISNWRL